MFLSKHSSSFLTIQNVSTKNFISEHSKYLTKTTITYVNSQNGKKYCFQTGPKKIHSHILNLYKHKTTRRTTTKKVIMLYFRSFISCLIRSDLFKLLKGCLGWSFQVILTILNGQNGINSQSVKWIYSVGHLQKLYETVQLISILSIFILTISIISISIPNVL